MARDESNRENSGRTRYKKNRMRPPLLPPWRSEICILVSAPRFAAGCEYSQAGMEDSWFGLQLSTPLLPRPTPFASFVLVTVCFSSTKVV